MDEEPEAERAIAVVRLAYDELLKRMAAGFTEALAAVGLDGSRGPVADACVSRRRAERRAARSRTSSSTRSASRWVPSSAISCRARRSSRSARRWRCFRRSRRSGWPRCSRARRPTSRSSSSNGKLAARVEQTVMPGFADRLRFLKAKVPDVVDLTLDKLLEHVSTSKLESTIGDASLVLVRSQEIDFAGELDTGGLRAPRHGHRDRRTSREPRGSSQPRASSRSSSPQTTGTSSRRAERRTCGSTSRAATRSSCIAAAGSGAAGRRRRGRSACPRAELGYDSDLDFVFPTGLGVFKAGGGLTYHHGGTSLQEMVIPVRHVPDSGGSEPPPPVERRSSRGRSRRDHEPRLQRAPHARGPHDRAGRPFRVVLLVGRRAGRRGGDGRRRRARPRHRHRDACSPERKLAWE